MVGKIRADSLNPAHGLLGSNKMNKGIKVGRPETRLSQILDGIPQAHDIQAVLLATGTSHGTIINDSGMKV